MDRKTGKKIANFAFVAKNEMIEFETDGVALPALEFGRLERWIMAVADSHGKVPARISYCFCSDEKILEANREFLGHDYFTDVITFDYSRHDRISGDILISLDTVASNAELVGDSYERELLRVIIHGVLHLCGINDKGPGEREVMEREENSALRLYEEIER